MYRISFPFLGLIACRGGFLEDINSTMRPMLV